MHTMPYTSTRRPRSAHSILSMTPVVSLVVLLATGAAPRLAAQAVTPAIIADSVASAGQPGPRARSYVGAAQRLSRVAGQTAWLIGVDGAWVSRPGYAVGIAAYGRIGANLTNPRAPIGAQNDVLDFGYGGVTLGYVQPVGADVHVFARALLGGGGINYRAARNDATRNALQNTFAVTEPTIGADVAVGTFARIGIEGGYRFASQVAFDGLRSSDIRGPSGGVTIRFGGF